ncbi:hypothetical protein CS542_04695 [Pedobacter sp. IW39]|nr:hypothetical protein CS542_04695 [Pedobacter sp. IW39]
MVISLAEGQLLKEGQAIVSSSGLAQNTTYFYIFALNSSCSGGPIEWLLAYRHVKRCLRCRQLKFLLWKPA